MSELPVEGGGGGEGGVCLGLREEGALCVSQPQEEHPPRYDRAARSELRRHPVGVTYSHPY